VPGNWLGRSQEKKIDIKEINFQGIYGQTDSRSCEISPFLSPSRKLIEQGPLSLLSLLAHVQTFLANPEIPPLHSFLCSVAIDKQT
jgi:hypothetical protein